MHAPFQSATGDAPADSIERFIAAAHLMRRGFSDKTAPVAFEALGAFRLLLDTKVA